MIKGSITTQETAVLWTGRERETFSVTFETVWNWVYRFAHVLQKYHVHPDDMVCLYLPQLPEQIAGALGTNGVGAIPFFCSDERELQKLHLLTKAKIALTTDELLPAFDGLCFDKVIVLKRGEGTHPLTPGRDVWFHEVMARASAEPIEIKLEGHIGYSGMRLKTLQELREIPPFSSIYGDFIEGNPQTMVEK